MFLLTTCRRLLRAGFPPTVRVDEPGAVEPLDSPAYAGMALASPRCSPVFAGEDGPRLRHAGAVRQRMAPSPTPRVPRG